MKFQLWLDLGLYTEDGLLIQKVDLGFAHSAEFDDAEQAAEFAAHAHKAIEIMASSLKRIPGKDA